MNEREQKIYDKYIAEGYDVIKAGAPDLILLKDEQIAFVEVKSPGPNGKLNEAQKRAFILLRKHGFSAKIEIVQPPPISREDSDYNAFMRSMTRRERDEYINLPDPERTKAVDDWLTSRGVST